MTITDEARYHLHQRLESVLGPQEASVLMEHLPPVGWADVATKRDLDHLHDRIRLDAVAMEGRLLGAIADLRVADQEIRTELVRSEQRVRADMASMEQGIRADMTAMEQGIRGDMASMEQGIRADMTAMEQGIRADMASMEQSLRAEIAALRVDLHQELRSMQVRLLGAFAALATVLVTLSSVS